MLSPRLLEEFRSYWKVARPKTWQFPGDICDIPGQPITRFAVEMACRQAHRATGISKPITRIACPTRSTRLLESCIDVCKIQLLGHRSLLMSTSDE